MTRERSAAINAALLEAAFDRVVAATRGPMALRGDQSAVNTAKAAYFELRCDIERLEQQDELARQKREGVGVFNPKWGLQ